MDFQFLVQHVRSFEAATLSQQTLKVELKNQEVFLDSSAKWGHKANCCPQNCGERKANTENHNWPQQKPVNQTLPRNYCQGRKTWTETNGLLAAQCEQLVDFQNPGGFEFYPQEFNQALRVNIGEKSPASWGWWAENNSKTCQSFLYLTRPALSRNHFTSA